MFDISLNESSVDTINAALLCLSKRDWDVIIFDNALSSNDDSSVTFDKNFLVLNVENSSLFVSLVNDILTQSEIADGEKLSQDENTDLLSNSFKFFSNMNLQLVDSSDLLISFSTSSSNSSFSATQISTKTNHCRLKSKQSKMIKMTVSRKNSER